jgi:hypothetical protein
MKYKPKVNDYIIQRKGIRLSYLSEGAHKITEIIGDDRCRLDNDKSYMSFLDDFRPATSEEIEAATKKFPYYYKIGKYNSYSAHDGNIRTNELLIIDHDDMKSFFLNLKIWKEIGKRKGWL